jgi:hypothetical protein
VTGAAIVRLHLPPDSRASNAVAGTSSTASTRYKSETPISFFVLPHRARAMGATLALSRLRASTSASATGRAPIALARNSLTDLIVATRRA